MVLRLSATRLLCGPSMLSINSSTGSVSTADASRMHGSHGLSRQGTELGVTGLQLITNGGRSVHPDKVAYKVKDPLEKADWFQAGAHTIPETEDFLRIIGHFADNDHDLHTFE